MLALLHLSIVGYALTAPTRYPLLHRGPPTVLGIDFGCMSASDGKQNQSAEGNGKYKAIR